MVISIIALLIAILLPALAQAKFAAQNTRCNTQVRQVALASFAYAADNKNYVPDRQFATDLQTAGYLNIRQVLYCPIQVDSANNWTALRIPGWHYGGNLMMMSQGFNTDARPSVQIEQVIRPSKGMFYSESSWRGPTYTHYPDWTEMIALGRTDSAWANPPHPINKGGKIVSRNINVAYLDGHGGTISLEGETVLADFRANTQYPFNYKSFWAWNATFTNSSDGCWDRAPFTD